MKDKKKIYREGDTRHSKNIVKSILAILLAFSMFLTPIAQVFAQEGGLLNTEEPQPVNSKEQESMEIKNETSDNSILANENEVVVNVSDFGADPTGVKDSTEQIQKAIDSLKTIEGNKRLVFPKGTYLFYPDKAVKRELYISNTVGADQNYRMKNIGMLFEGISDLTVDGGDSLFLYHGKMMTFATLDTNNIVFKTLELILMCQLL